MEQYKEYTDASERVIFMSGLVDPIKELIKKEKLDSIEILLKDNKIYKQNITLEMDNISIEMKKIIEKFKQIIDTINLNINNDKDEHDKIKQDKLKIEEKKYNILAKERSKINKSNQEKIEDLMNINHTNIENIEENYKNLLDKEKSIREDIVKEKKELENKQIEMKSNCDTELEKRKLIINE